MYTILMHLFVSAAIDHCPDYETLKKVVVQDYVNHLISTRSFPICQNCLSQTSLKVNIIN